MARFKRFTVADIDHAGMIELFTSGEVIDAVSETTEYALERANDLGGLHGPARLPLYGSDVGIGKKIAVGHVFPATKLGQIDNQYHHTLDSINH